MARFVVGLCNAVLHGPRLFSEKYGEGIPFPPSVFTGLSHISDAFLLRIIVSLLLF